MIETGDRLNKFQMHNSEALANRVIFRRGVVVARVQLARCTKYRPRMCACACAAISAQSDKNLFGHYTTGELGGCFRSFPFDKAANVCQLG